MGITAFAKLKWAIFHGQKELVESLLKNDAPVDIVPYNELSYRSPLHSAVYLGDPNIVKELLDRGASPNVYNKNNETALMLAAKFGKYNIVDILLAAEKLKNVANNENFAHLHVACMRNRVDVVKKLIERRADINAAVKPESVRWSGYTPLHFAVLFQSTETVRFLLSLGADFTIKDSNQNTALHSADMVRNEQIIDMILEAHKNVVQNPTNREGLSHFHIACTRDNPEIVESFIRNGVNLEDSVSSTASNWSDFSAIHFAVYYDCTDNVKLLLMQGGRRVFPSTDNSGELDLVKCAYGTGNQELVNLILNRDQLTKKTILVEKLPDLHYSCIYQDLEAVKIILAESSSELNTPIWQGSTPLHLAVERGDESIIKYLLDEGAHCESKDANGKTPLHLAFDRNMKMIILSILQNCARFTKNHVDNDGLSHLHIACTEYQIEAVEHLIKLGADINSPVKFDCAFWPGFTPLHLAAKFTWPKVARVLLAHSASYYATDRNGLTAFDIAILEDCFTRRRGVRGIMEAILSHHLKQNAHSFNDRGFSLLHLLSWDDHDRTEAMREFIREHAGEINKAVDMTNTPWDGYTPLHFAMAYGDPDHSELLVEMGADIFSKAASGDIPFHLSMSRSVRLDRRDVEPKITLDFHDFARMLDNPVGTKGDSLFHVACSTSNVEWIKYFLNHGVDPNLRKAAQDHEFGQTPLHVATRHRSKSSLEIVTLLLEHGASATSRDAYLNTPLHNMIANMEPKIIDPLLNHGADVNARNAFLETPLIVLCKNPLYYTNSALTETIITLLNRGADINLADEQGENPLSLDRWFFIDDFASAVEVLLKHVMKLGKIGSPVSDDTFEAFSSLSKRSSRQITSKIYNFSQQCDIESSLLASIRVNAHTTLRDTLFKDPNGLSVLSENAAFQQIISANDFWEKFPIYGSMLELQLKRGQVRKLLLSRSQEVLKSIINIPMPRECLERISQSLTNEDLNNIIKSPNRL